VKLKLFGALVVPLVLSALGGLHVHVAAQAHVCMGKHWWHSDAPTALASSSSARLCSASRACSKGLGCSPEGPLWCTLAALQVRGQGRDTLCAALFPGIMLDFLLGWCQ